MQGASQNLGGSPHLGALLSLSSFRTRRARRSLQVEGGVQVAVSSQAHLPPPSVLLVHTHTPARTHIHTPACTHTQSQRLTHLPQPSCPPDTHTHVCKLRHNHRG